MSTAQAVEPGTNDSSTHAARAEALRRAVPKWIEVAAGHSNAPARNPSLPTLVGLLMLILCFFVVLTSISLKDKNREKSVMTSLEQTFTSEGAARPNAEPTDAQAKQKLGDLLAKLNPEVPLVSGVTPETADEYLLQLPRGLVFAGGGAALADGFRQTLIQALAALKTGPADFAYEVEVTVSAPRIDDDTIAKGAAIAAALRAAGFANDAAIVGLAPGSGDIVALTIRLRPNAKPAPMDSP